MAVVSMATIIKYCQEGFGRHIYHLQLGNIAQINKYNHIAELFNILSNMFARLSISVFLLSLFGVQKKWRTGLYVLISFLVFATIPIVVIILAQCRPIQKLWYPQTPGKCWNPQDQIGVGYYQGCKKRPGAGYCF